MRIVVYAVDLMDRSKISAAGDVVFARGATEAEGADVIVVDLATFASLVADIRRAAPGARIVGYGRHTDVEVLQQARASGADEAVPRSRFFTDLAGFLARPSPPS